MEKRSSKTLAGAVLIYLVFAAAAPALADGQVPAQDLVEKAAADAAATSHSIGDPIVAEVQDKLGDKGGKPPQEPPKAEPAPEPVETSAVATAEAMITLGSREEKAPQAGSSSPPSVMAAVTGTFEYLAGAVRGAIDFLTGANQGPEGDGTTNAQALVLKVQTAAILAIGAASVQAIPLAVFTGATLAVENPWLRDPKRFLAPLLAPLYTRLEKSELLDHQVRDMLHKTIDVEPGVTIATLVDRSGVSRNAVSYHLRVMEKQGLITSRRLGRTVHLFINGARYEEPVKAAVAILKNDTTLAIGEYIRSHPGSPQREVCDAFTITPGAANWHIRKLEDMALITRERDGRQIKYFPGTVWEHIASPSPVVSAA